MGYDRDFNPRSVAFIGLSALLHGGLVTALMLQTNFNMPAKELPTEASAVELTEGAAPIAEQPSELPAAANEPIAPTPEEVKVETPKEVVVAPPTPVEEPKPVVEKPKPRAKPKAKPVVQSLPEKKAPEPKEEPKLLESAPVTAEDVAATESAPAEEWVPTNAPTAETKEALPENLSPVISDDGHADELAAQEAAQARVEPTEASTESGTTSPHQPSGAQPEGSGSGKKGFGFDSDDTIVEAAQRSPLPGNPLPAYPREDRLAGKQGDSIVTGKVEANGAISQVRLEKSSGSRSLDNSAVTAFKSWKFQPGNEVTVRKTFKFSLAGEAQVSGGGFKKSNVR